VEDENRESVKRIAKQGSATFLSQIVRILLRLAKSVILARVLGPTKRGLLSLIVVIPEFIVSFGNLGFGPAVLYYVAKKKYDLRIVMGGVVLFILIMGPALAMVGMGALKCDFILKGDAKIVRTFAAVILVAIPFLLIDHLGARFLMAKGKILILNMVSICQAGIPLFLFIMLCAVMKDHLDAAVWSWFISLFGIAIVPFIFLKREGAYPPIMDGHFLKKGFTYGIASYLAQCFQMALLRSDFFFISALLGPTELGYYTVSTKMAEMLLILPESFVVPFVPLLFGMQKNESDMFMCTVTRLVLFVMLVICIGACFFGKIFIGLVFGYEFLPAYRPLVLLLPGIFAFGLFPFFKFELFGRGMQGKVAGFTAIGLMTNLLLNYFMIPKWGIEAAAVSSSVGYVSVVFLLFRRYCRISGTSSSDVLIVKKNDFSIVYQSLKTKLKK